MTGNLLGYHRHHHLGRLRVVKAVLVVNPRSNRREVLLSSELLSRHRKDVAGLDGNVAPGPLLWRTQRDEAKARRDHMRRCHGPGEGFCGNNGRPIDTGCGSEAGRRGDGCWCLVFGRTIDFRSGSAEEDTAPNDDSAPTDQKKRMIEGKSNDAEWFGLRSTNCTYRANFQLIIKSQIESHPTRGSSSRATSFHAWKLPWEGKDGTLAQKYSRHGSIEEQKGDGILFKLDCAVDSINTARSCHSFWIEEDLAMP